jgi:hypothetical protein
MHISNADYRSGVLPYLNNSITIVIIEIKFIDIGNYTIGRVLSHETRIIATQRPFK